MQAWIMVLAILSAMGSVLGTIGNHEAPENVFKTDGVNPIPPKQ